MLKIVVLSFKIDKNRCTLVQNRLELMKIVVLSFKVVRNRCSLLYCRSKSSKIDENRCAVVQNHSKSMSIVVLSRLVVRPVAYPSARPLVCPPFRPSARLFLRPSAVPSVRFSALRRSARPSSARLSFRPFAHLGLAEALFRTTDCPSFRRPALASPLVCLKIMIIGVLLFKMVHSW